MTLLDAKVVFLGAPSVGKTCIVCRAVSNDFDSEMPSTIGASHAEKVIELPGAEVSLQLWDTAGQERFRTMAPMYYRGAVVAVLVFSLTDDQTVKEVRGWADEIKMQTQNMPVLFVVGNKLDLTEERAVPVEQGEAVANDIEAIYYEVSARTGAGVTELFFKIAQEALNRLQTNTTKPPDPVSVAIEPDKQGRTKKKKSHLC
jgi:small GTP-binding protein